MRPLEKTNPNITRPSHFLCIALLLPFVFGLASIAFIAGAASEASLSQNPGVLGFAIFLVFTSLVSITAWICKWDWRAQYFGMSMFYLGSAALIGITPFGCIILYGTLPDFLRLLLSALHLTAHTFWSRRFVIHYARINNDGKLKHLLYQEENDAVYYIQKGDKLLFEKIAKLDQIPPDRYILASAILALLMIIFMTEIRRMTGLPFVYSFLAVIGFPLSVMFIGFAVRGWLIFFYYPLRIEKETGKRVYVDLTASSMSRETSQQ